MRGRKMNYIKEIIEEGGHFDGALLVKSCERGVANNGNEYLSIVFQDVTGSINSKKWTVEANDLKVLIPGKIVMVTGDIFKYKGHPQMKVEKVEEVDNSLFDMQDFYISCPINDEDLYKSVEEIIDVIEDDEIRKLVKALIEENEEKYMTYPAAVSVHHAYRCGIVYHSLSIAKMAIKVADHYKTLSKDYLVAGALLHDLGKTKEMQGVMTSGYTLEGNLLGHISMGAFLVESKARELNISKNKTTILTHIILAHHGQFEYGSPVLPQTPEALVLHMLDDLDSKMNILDNALSDVKVGDFSQKIPYLDMKAYLKIK